MQAPFNFVPVSKKVFFPKWGKQISQDVPFSDAESGYIKISIKAENPIYVRNGHIKSDRDSSNDKFLSFSNINGAHFIPASSLKGSIRNVLEILSFSKLKLDANMKYATRDWYNPELYDLKQKQNQIHCGWLHYDQDQNICIIDCGIPYRINHKRIDEYFESKNINLSFEKYFYEQNRVININKPHKLGNISFDPKTSVFKYALLNYDIDVLRNLTFAIDPVYANEHQPQRVMVSDNNSIVGTIVFTGSPNKWKFPRETKGDGKFYEFVFPEPDAAAERNPLIINEIDYNHFKFFHSDSPDWKFWNEKLENGGRVPVFFRRDDTNEMKVMDFGISFLYKKPFKSSPYELLSESHKEDDKDISLDMAECIFGKTSSKASLKGRVQFGHAFAEVVKVADRQELVLGSPKASYYPIYVKQMNGQNGIVSSYLTYSNLNASISGWKRYLIRANTWSNKAESDKLNTPFIPLDRGSVFTSRISFHNLRKAEIGALLSALTFHNNDDYFHMIGMAKPYGYGKVKITLDLENSKLKYAPVEYMCVFEKEIVEDPFMFGGRLEWNSSQEIKQLFTLAYDYNLAGTRLLYMALNNADKENEFLKAKAQREYMRLYSELMNNLREPASLYSAEKIRMKEEEEKLQKEKEVAEQLERIKQEKEKQEREAEEARMRKEIRANEALKGIDLTKVDITKRDAWDSLKKVVETYICHFHMGSNYKKVLSANPDGALPDKDHDELLSLIQKMVDNYGPKEKAKWYEKFDKNPFLKKVAEWVGRTKAENLFT